MVMWEFYPAYLEHFYHARPGMRDAGYDEQMAALVADHFCWPVDVGLRLRDLGCEVKICIPNAEPLQRAWCRENGNRFDEANWRYSIPIKQAKARTPDIMWMGVSSYEYYGACLRELKESVHKVFCWIASPFPADIDLSSVNCILTSHDNFVRKFRSMNRQCERMLPAFESNIQQVIGERRRNVDISFIGGLTDWHLRRREILAAVHETLGLNIWGYGVPRLFPITGIRSLLWRIRHAGDRAYLLSSAYRGGAWGMEMYEILAQSLINLNIHAEVAEGHAGNIRMFEATGMGSLLMTEDMHNITEMFAPGTEVVTYSSAEDLLEKARYYLGNKTALCSIAQAGQRRTLRDHTSRIRAEQLKDIFIKHL